MKTMKELESATEIFKRLKQQMSELFEVADTSNCRCFFSPGRVNLIGDHIDYCGGHVMPVALSMGTYAVARYNDTKKVRLRSLQKDNRVEFELSEIVNNPKDGWGNYPKGIFEQYAKLQAPLSGLDILYSGNLPIESGLSSSASLIVCTAVLIEHMFGFRLDQDELVNRKKMALLCKTAENTFVNIQSGIMDQATIALAKKDQALLLNCHTLAVEYLPLPTNQVEFVIANSCKSRELIFSAYNQRCEETRQALAYLQQQDPDLEELCHLLPNQLEQVLEQLKDQPILQRRTRHVVTEEHRVQSSKRLLEQSRWRELGALLTQSHQSLKEDYQVSCVELDVLVDSFLADPHVYGARLTGAGFGGCMLALLEKEHQEEVCNRVQKEYKQMVGQDCQIYPLISHQATHECS